METIRENFKEEAGPFDLPPLPSRIKNLPTTICPPSFQGKDKMAFCPSPHALQSFLPWNSHSCPEI